MCLQLQKLLDKLLNRNDPSEIRHPHGNRSQRRPPQSRPNSPSAPLPLQRFPTIPNPNAGRIITSSVPRERRVDAQSRATTSSTDFVSTCGQGDSAGTSKHAATSTSPLRGGRQGKAPTRPPTPAPPAATPSDVDESEEDEEQVDANADREEVRAKGKGPSRRELSDRDMLGSEKRYRESMYGQKNSP